MGRAGQDNHDLTNKNTIGEFNAGNVDFDYYKVEEIDEWKVNIVKELIEIRSGELEVPGMEVDDLKEILECICTG